MSILSMVMRELLHRKGNSLLAWLGVTAAVGLLVGMLAFLEMHDMRAVELAVQEARQTRDKMTHLSDDIKQAMQRLGYNATILPSDQSLSDWYAEDYAAKTMPQSIAQALDDSHQLVDRYLPQLRRRLVWPERKWTVIVVGIGRERILATSVCNDQPLAHTLSTGTCMIGYEVAQGLNLQQGQTITLAGHGFRVDQVREEQGSKDDISIWIPLADAQQLFDLPGRINEILIVEHANVWGNQQEVQRRVRQRLPETQVVEFASETMAQAHARIKVADQADQSIKMQQAKSRLLQRERTKTLILLLPVGILLSAGWIGLLMYTNVRERIEETGILMAIGFSVNAVRRLFLGKAVLLGVAGALSGGVIGLLSSLLLVDASGQIPLITGGLCVRMFAFSIGVGLAAGWLGSSLPLRVATRVDPVQSLGRV